VSTVSKAASNPRTGAPAIGHELAFADDRSGVSQCALEHGIPPSVVCLGGHQADAAGAAGDENGLVVEAIHGDFKGVD
jgi:hypothetical protein